MRRKAFLLAFTFFASTSTIGNQFALAQTEAPPEASATEERRPLPPLPESIRKLNLPLLPPKAAPDTTLNGVDEENSYEEDPYDTSGYSDFPLEDLTPPKDDFTENLELAPDIPENTIQPGNQLGTSNILSGSRADALLKRKPAFIRFYDIGRVVDGVPGPDGDAITVRLNGNTIVENMVLTGGAADVRVPIVPGQTNTLALDLKPGINRLEIYATSLGIVKPSATVYFQFQDQSFFSGLPRYGFEFYGLGKAYTETFTLAYPALTIASASLEPEIALHVREAWALGKPRLCTKESSKNITLNGMTNEQRRNKRRSDSLSKFEDGKAHGEKGDRDEYPPAVCIQNGGNANVKYTISKQNQDAGRRLGAQLRRGKFKDYDSFELIISP